MYEIKRGAELELPLEDVCQQILKHLVPALEFPGLGYGFDRTGQQAICQLRASRGRPYKSTAFESHCRKQGI